MALPIDVAEYILVAFPHGEQAAALNALDAAVNEHGNVPDARLLRCATVASRGDLHRLLGYITDLRIDYRNVIVEGEYDVIDGRLVHARNLAEPIPPGTRPHR